MLVGEHMSEREIFILFPPSVNNCSKVIPSLHKLWECGYVCLHIAQEWLNHFAPKLTILMP
jgi:hypothetical protein